jgi:hypothetical protein
MMATAASTIAPAITVRSEIDSSRNAHPRTTATTGFTYAYVETSGVRAFRSNHTYDANPANDPNTMR